MYSKIWLERLSCSANTFRSTRQHLPTRLQQKTEYQCDLSESLGAQRRGTNTLVFSTHRLGAKLVSESAAADMHYLYR